MISRVTLQKMYHYISFRTVMFYFIPLKESGKTSCWREVQKLKFRSHLNSGVTSIVFVKDGKYVITGSQERCVNMWSTETGIFILDLFSEHFSRNRQMEIKSNHILSAFQDVYCLQIMRTAKPKYCFNENCVLQIGEQDDDRSKGSTNVIYKILFFNLET